MGKPHHDAVCWSCQGVLFDSDPNRIKLAEGFPLPVCRKCWSAIPVADRVRLAMAFRDRGVNQGNIADVLEWVRQCLSQAGMADSLPDWLRGGSDHLN